MKWVKWSLAIVLVVTAAVVFSAKLFQKKYTFYYYPEWNAYYDVHYKNYIYSIDGGKTWDTITNSSENVANTLGERIVLHSTSPEIWTENAVHRDKYGGTLNDLVGMFLQTGEDERKIKKKNTGKDSSYSVSNNIDSVKSDSIEEVEKWVKETHTQEKSAKIEEPIQTETEPAEEDVEISDTGDSTEADPG